MQDHKYSSSLILGIDLLTFSKFVEREGFEMVNKTIESWEALVKSYVNTYPLATLNNTFVIQNLRNDGGAQQNDFTFQIFLDRILVTCPINKINGIVSTVVHLLLSLVIIQFEMFKKNLSIRGALTVGDVFIDDNKSFGKGIVRCSELSNASFFPRVLIDYVVMEDLLKEETYLEDWLITQEDHLYYLDIFKYLKEFDKRMKAIPSIGEREELTILSKSYHISIQDAIKYGMHLNDLEMRMKYDWIGRKYREMTSFN